MQRVGKEVQDGKSLFRSEDDCPVIGLAAYLHVLDRVDRNIFVKDADLEDPEHDAPDLRYRRPCETAIVEGFQPELNFQGPDALRDLLAPAGDKVIADIMLDDGNGVSRLRANRIFPEIGLQAMLRKSVETHANIAGFIINTEKESEPIDLAPGIFLRGKVLNKPNC